MVEETQPRPRQYQGVMVSSTFNDLREYRAALMDALRKEELFAIGMEDYVPSPGDTVLSSSLEMVRKGSAFIGLVSRRYGQVPEDDPRNPHGYSICRLEFEEAQRLGRPTLVFIMGEGYKGTEADFEFDPEKRKKLEAYRERAKEGRIYVVVESLEDFTRQAIHAVGKLRRFLDEEKQESTGGFAGAPTQPKVSEKERDPIPTPPALYAEPPYIASHSFVGRKAELDQLSEWASAANPNPVFLLDAIGGSGKSMLAWEWTRNHSLKVRSDWAGRFWYSFYEKGAVVADFCRRSLVYITGEPMEELKRQKTPELGERLLHHLQARPWLMILDGLERLLVSYHRFDAAQLRDEEAGTSDAILQRDPSAAIRPEDEDLLRALAGAVPSKLLLTSRLTPRVLLNPAWQTISGVWRVALTGLRPSDAEGLLRSCGVRGTSQVMQDYLRESCACHPLVTGIIAGLVLHYFPDRGNFDAWATDPGAGAELNLAELNLVQKRNDILRSAFEKLPEKGRELLSILALFSEAVDAETLQALNPYVPPEPVPVRKPEEPEEHWRWESMALGEREAERHAYSEQMELYEEYQRAVETRLQSPEYRNAPANLTKTVLDLERRGLLQYDSASQHYDLHPVVRSVAAGGLRQMERDRYGALVLDFFSKKAHPAYIKAEALDDVRNGLRIVNTLLQMGRYSRAFDVYRGNLSNALLFNLDAHAEVLALVRPLFHAGWVGLPESLDDDDGAYLANGTAIALRASGNLAEALALQRASAIARLRQSDFLNLRVQLSNVAEIYLAQNRWAKAQRFLELALYLSSLRGKKAGLYIASLRLFQQFGRLGRWVEAKQQWKLLGTIRQPSGRTIYRPGDAELAFTWFQFWQGKLSEPDLAKVERIAQEGTNRAALRQVHFLRGELRLAWGDWAGANSSFFEAVRMAREVGKEDSFSEARLALSKLRMRQLPDPVTEASLLSQLRDPAHRALAEFWLAIGDSKRAKEHAIKAYEKAWADGEPYVFRFELNRAKTLLKEVGTPIPDLPPYDPAKDPKEPWEDEVENAIEKLCLDEAALAANKDAKKGGAVENPVIMGRIGAGQGEFLRSIFSFFRRSEGDPDKT